MNQKKARILRQAIRLGGTGTPRQVRRAWKAALVWWLLPWLMETP